MDAYEALRTAVVQGTAPPQALSAVAREGMLRGLDRQILAPTTATVIEPGVPCLSPTLAAPALIGVLANIVLRIRAEAHHVY